MLSHKTWGYADAEPANQLGGRAQLRNSKKESSCFQGFLPMGGAGIEPATSCL